MLSGSAFAQSSLCLQAQPDEAVEVEFQKRFGLQSLAVNATCGDTTSLVIEGVNLPFGNASGVKVPMEHYASCYSYADAINKIVSAQSSGPKLVGICGSSSTLVRVLINAVGVSKISQTVMNNSAACHQEAARMNSKN